MDQLREWATTLNGGLMEFIKEEIGRVIKDIAVECVRNPEKEAKDFYVVRGEVAGLLRTKGMLDKIVREYQQRLKRDNAVESSAKS
jgi:hypothetical protein